MRTPGNLRYRNQSRSINLTTPRPSVKRRAAGRVKGQDAPMICPPQPPAPFIENWVVRHRDPVSFLLHMIGIPPTVLGVVLIPVYLVGLSVPVFLLALASFVGGYLVQFLGHMLDGTESGEMRSFKRFLGRWRGSSPATAPVTPQAPRQSVA